MRIERVEAHVFGPLKGETLELAPGMTVVHGPNEAGKSSWHAALYAGLCGRRRGPGAGTREDRAFAERHRPWHSERWEVGVVVELAGGRRVELRHDLAGGVDCRATDLALGRDVSDEVMFEGGPDGSRWLGLNRRTLPSTVCVRQADVLGVLQDPDQLQEALQRAAATGGADATAEQALLQIATFRRERIGLDRRNSTKPLRRALEEVECARVAVEAAREGHEEYLRLVARRDEAGVEARARAGRLAAARSAQAEAEVGALRARVARARELSDEVGAGPPPGPPADDELAERVRAALAAHEARPPATRPLEGEDAERLAAALHALPEAPSGDVEPAAAVLAAHEAWSEARQAVRLHERSRPVEHTPPGTGGLTAGELRRLAEVLRDPLPEVDPALRAEAERLRVAAGQRARPGAAALLVVAVLLAGGAAAATLTGLAVVGVALGMLSVAAAGGGLAAALRAPSGVSPGEMTAALARLAIAEERSAEATRAREAALARIARTGLEPDPEDLLRSARLLDGAQGGAERLARWRQDAATLGTKQAEAAARLWEALRARGEMLSDAPDPGLAFGAYERACRRRAEQAVQAARRADLDARLRARRAAEEDARDREARRVQAHEALRAAAAAAGEDPSGAAGPLAERLRGWLERWASARRREQARREAWGELRHLLDGRTFEELRSELEQRERVLRPGRRVEPAEPPPAPEEVGALEVAAAQAARCAAHLEGQVADRARDLPGVAEAEERLVRGREDLARLRALDTTLDVTRRFLEAARDRVHRDIAPQLKAAVERRLPAVTGGRYDQVAVDPASLAVQVRATGAPWRPATGLSHGTAEQVYLLLRLAMAEHLVTNGETAPLVLDDVTVQSDRARTEVLLDLLHDVAGERQVVVFSQEEAVLAWAERRLQGPRDALVRLEPLGVSL